MPRKATKPKATAHERRLSARAAVHASWSRTEDASVRTAAARQAFRDRWADEIDPEHKLDPADRARRAESALRSHMASLALKASQARRRARAEKRTASR